MKLINYINNYLSNYPMKKKYFLFIFVLFAFGFSQTFAGVVVLNGLTHTHNGVSGSTITGSIKLINEGEKESRILIYQQDIILSCKEAVDYQDIGSHNHSLGKWLQTSVNEKVMLPNEEYEITYTIKVPSGTVESGTYWSIIMIEMTDQLQVEKRQGININSKVRYGVQILTDIGASESPAIIFEKVDFKQINDSTKIMQIKLKNDGVFLSKTKLSIEIFNDQGVKVKVIIGPQKKVYPSYCNDFEIELKDIPKGKYSGVLVADNGTDLFGENINIEII